MRTLLAFLLVGPLLWSVGQSVDPPPDMASTVAHGRYIVERVSMCFECHTPRDEDGTLQRDHWLFGAPIPAVAPAFQGTDWAIRAPRIAGMPGYTEAEGVRLLTRGIDRTGKPLRLPMPPFRFSESDARAVVAYLKALEATPGP
jgi:mono/diheme cytochrome c family protein